MGFTAGTTNVVRVAQNMQTLLHPPRVRTMVPRRQGGYGTPRRQAGVYLHGDAVRSVHVNLHLIPQGGQHPGYIGTDMARKGRHAVL